LPAPAAIACEPAAGIFKLSAIDDRPVKRPNPGCGSIVFQQYSLFPWISVLENVAFDPRILGTADPIGTARTFLGLLGLERYERLGSSLSGGMQ